MRVLERLVYSFDELTDDAKQKAIEKHWEFVSKWFSDDAEHIFEDAAAIADILGIDLKTRAVKLLGGGTRNEPCIYYSGFSSQGDGACFEGSYCYAKGSQKAIRDYAPQDKELHRIADELAAIQKPYFYRLEASAKHSGHYYHSGCMSVSAWHRDDQYRDIGDAEDELKEVLRDFANWIYARLESEYEYRTSEEQIIESIKANEYEFFADGSLS